MGFDLTNTSLRVKQPKAERGHSKEKRKDCPLRAWMLDVSGFVRRSEVFAGAVNEDATLKPMLDALQILQSTDQRRVAFNDLYLVKGSGSTYVAPCCNSTR